MNNNNEYISVSQLNKYIKTCLDEDENLQYVYLKGEISNFKNHPTGHFYFTLKDESSRILAVMFRNQAIKINFKPIDGMKVLVIGRVSAYEANGNYQIYVNEMVEDGLGNLYIEFEKLKAKLSKLGYFEEERKKTIPMFPKKIGVVTAKTGAAIKDIITTINRRYKLASIYLFPSLVQGKESSSDIVSNIEIADNYGLDVIIVGRGGGSIEDLWAFNEEKVAQAIYDAKTPIISAVGHEIDWTISDFVADLRAPTPTAAAELAVPNTKDLLELIRSYRNRSYIALRNGLRIDRQKLFELTNSYVLKNPMNIYEIKAQQLDIIYSKFQYVAKEYFTKINNKYCNLIDKLTTLNPLLTIKRGYAIASINDKVIASIKNVKKDDNLKVELKDGYIITKVTNTEVKDGKNN